jgi:hypothetical protein
MSIDLVAFVNDVTRVIEERDALRASHERLRSDLAKYGVHENGCDKYMSLADVDCTCGLDAALAKAGGV